jgi:hypothetical protein
VMFHVCCLEGEYALLQSNFTGEVFGYSGIIHRSSGRLNTTSVIPGRALAQARNP